jgi:hypothetical protein
MALKSADGVKTYMAKVPGDPSTNISYAYGGGSNFTLRAILEKGASELPAGNIVITNKSGVKLPANTDDRLLDNALTFGNSLVGHWPLNGHVGATNQITGVAGSLVSASLNTGRFGEVEGSYQVSSGGHIAHTAVTFTTGQAHSFAVWVKWTGSIPPTDFVLPFGDRTYTSRTIYFVGPSANYYFDYRADDGAETLIANVTQSIFDGNWHQVAWTVNTSKLLSLYIDGVFKQSGTITTSSGMNYRTIGDGYGNNSYAWNGRLADVRIYNQALSYSDVRLLYQATKP